MSEQASKRADKYIIKETGEEVVEAVHEQRPNQPASALHTLQSSSSCLPMPARKNFILHE